MQLFLFLEKVKAEDIKRIAERMLASKASVVGYGTLKNLPAYENIDKAIGRRDVRLLKPGSYSFFK